MIINETEARAFIMGLSDTEKTNLFMLLQRLSRLQEDEQKVIFSYLAHVSSTLSATESEDCT